MFGCILKVKVFFSKTEGEEKCYHWGCLVWDSALFGVHSFFYQTLRSVGWLVAGTQETGGDSGLVGLKAVCQTAKKCISRFPPSSSSARPSPKSLSPCHFLPFSLHLWSGSQASSDLLTHPPATATSLLYYWKEAFTSSSWLRPFGRLFHFLP